MARKKTAHTSRAITSDKMQPIGDRREWQQHE
jgi:hypothetical protein